MSSRVSDIEAIDRISGLVASDPAPLPLIGRLLPYAWGGRRYLRDLTGLDLPADQPAAEWWLGAHAMAPSLVDTREGRCRLDALIARAPERLLGARVAGRFGARLPFLLKLLDVRQMLSIQAHPSKPQAVRGFADENALGLPMDAAARNYRDDNHKPEAQVALTPFWMLFGFREPEDMAAILGERPELRPLAEHLDVLVNQGAAQGAAAVIRALYSHVMTASQETIDRLVEPLARRLVPRYRDGHLDRQSPDFWVARASEQIGAPDGHHDRGVLSIYLMNLVRLAPGEGTFIGAGVLHAYLEGIAVEIMANSDNVIRGGLTPKHVDVAELLRVLRFDAAGPRPLAVEPRGHHEQQYATPVEEFALGRLAFAGAGVAALSRTAGPEIVMVVDGEVSLRWNARRLSLVRGAAALIPAGLRYDVTADGPATAFRAFVPGDP